jgi:hypothetical protein
LLDLGGHLAELFGQLPKRFALGFIGRQLADQIAVFGGEAFPASLAGPS